MTYIVDERQKGKCSLAFKVLNSLCPYPRRVCVPVQRFLVGSILFFVALAFGTSVKADTIGTLQLSDCGTAGTACPAAKYQFDVTSTSAMLTITINGVPTAQNDYIGTVDLGFAPSSTISGLALTSAPSALTNWAYTTGSLNSNGSGCGSNGGAFVCATDLPSNPLSISQNGMYTWTWTFDPLNAALVAPGTPVHVGVQYGPNSANNWKGLQVSQTVLPAPEPASIILLGGGLLAVSGFTKRYKKS